MKKLKKILYSQKAAPYIFVLPFILSFAFFWIYPLFSTAKMSFQSILPGEVEWIGLKNYSKLLKDSAFHIAIANSFEYMIWTLVLLIPFPMIYACLMDSRLVKMKGLYKALLYLPALTSVVVAGTIFRLMFSELEGSQMNQFISWFGFEPIKWLKMKVTSYFALLTIACWRWTGVNMLYFLAGLKNIDDGLYEAAEIDGANGIKKFIYITMPLLKPTTIYVLTISVYAGLAMFLESFMLWNGNNSPNNIGLTIVGYLYRRGIEKNQLGYASAVGLVLLVIALSINVVQLIMNGTFKKEEK
ncbi:ABC transporter permease subunit [Anaerocolumna sedimenticola]|uniref:ABC transporter permease subunit n=1 Tax=Anaerocolumna sedimenticola TaxID=2696063 RepID=A0A6P1TM76_9FIRM|nr:sugar ABC transporter permease [Anaerocolumna sedimenticola]QHQ60775.1 ABC transporter permease subunit [Anaerocolumna sedimenticola]